MPVTLTYSEFFENKNNNLGFRKLLYESLKYNKPITLSLTENNVSLVLDSIRHDTVNLKGKWRSPLLSGRYQKVGALLLAPLLFHIQEFSLPHSCIYTLGKPYRSIADFFMRNLFYTAIRRESVSFNQADHGLGAGVLENSRLFTRRYLWIIKANLKEPIFDDDNASELLLSSAYIPTVQFSESVLEFGMLEYQARIDEQSTNYDHNMQIQNLMNLREKLFQSI